MAKRSERSHFIGRDAELATMCETLEKAAAGGTLKFVLVEGEPGIGKSCIVAEAAARLRAPFRVLAGQGHELERERPFGVMADACGVWGEQAGADQRAIARLLGGGGGTPASPDAGFVDLRFQLVEAFLRLLDRLAEQHPLLLLLDDMHWADPSTILVLGQLVRRLAARPIAVVATLRPSPRSPVLEQLRRELSADDAVHIDLGPLTDDQVHDLTVALTGATPGAGLRRLVSGTAGNPFFITEVVAALADDDRLSVRDGVADVSRPGAPPTLRSTIRHRLEFLPAHCLEALTVAAVISSRFRLDDLAVVVDRPASQLLGILDDALRTGLLIESDGAFAFRHHLVWEAIYHDLPSASREALHLQVAQRLAEVNRPAEQIATHFLAGAAPGDPLALSWLEQAAHEAMSRAPGVAAELLHGARQLAGGLDDVRDRVTVELATALTWSGRLDEAEEMLEDLSARSRGPALDVTIRLGLASVLIIQGKPGRAAELFDQLLAMPELTGRRRARAMADLSIARLLSGDVAGAEAAGVAALEEARAIGDAPAECGALCAAAWVQNVRGRTSVAVQLGEQAVALAERGSGPEIGRRYPHDFLATILMDADRLDDGRRMFDIGRRNAEAFGDTWQVPIEYLGAALADFHAGAYSDAVAALATAEEIAAEVSHRTLLVWSLALGAHLAIEQDDLAQAGRRLAAAEARVNEVGPGFGYDWLLWARARLLEAEGDVAAAAEQLGNAWDLAAMLGVLSQRRLIGPDLVRLQVAVGERARAQDTAAVMAEAAELSGGVRSLQAAALRCRGVADGDPSPLAAAVEIARGCPQRVEYARTCEDAGRVLVAAGRPSEARDLLGEAAAVYFATGARRSERRADALLRSLGVARGRRERRGRPATGWDALTPTELEVAAMAAEGLTNPGIGRRLFVSPRTVETHLSRVYAKLAVSSRVELAKLAASRR